MPQNPTETLFTHFAYFISEAKFGYNDWQLVAAEFGVNDVAEGVNRFYRSWRFGDDDRASNTVKFLRRVHDQDADTAFRVMERAYSMTDRANEEQVRKYPSLEYFEQDREEIPSGLPAGPIQSENFIDVDNVPGQFYPSLIRNITFTPEQII